MCKILGSWSSPFVMRARIAANLKNVKYEFLQEQPGVKSELLLKSNPIHKKIPVMIHNDKPICESLIIVQYVDDVFTSGTPILPTDAYDRSIQRFWAAYIDDKWFGLMSGIGMAKSDEARMAAITGFSEGLGLLEETFQKVSQGKGFFGGETIGLIDIALGSCLAWVRVTEKFTTLSFIDDAKTPGLQGWSESFCAHPAVKDVMPETGRLLEFAMQMLAPK